MRKLGGVGSSAGRRRIAEEIADCTSSAAPSMFRLRSNCRTIEVLPSDDVEVIVVTPAMVENWRSRIEATEAAIVSGLAPGSCAGDLDGREVDARDGGDGKLLVAEDAGDDEGRHHQDGHHRAADAEG